MKKSSFNHMNLDINSSNFRTTNWLSPRFLFHQITYDPVHERTLILQSPFNVNYGFDRWMYMFVKSAILLGCSRQVADSVKQSCNKSLLPATNQVKTRKK